MKKLILAATMLAATFTQSVFAQDGVTELYSTTIKQAAVPEVILTSIKKNFPKNVVTLYKTVPIEIVGYNVIVDDIAKADPKRDGYQIFMEGKDTKVVALYSSDGKLVNYRERIKNFALPQAIAADIAKNFPGYAIAKDQERIVINSKNESETHYKIEITKGKEKLHLIYDGAFMLMEKLRG